MKRIIFISLCVLGVLIIIGQVQGIVSLWKKQDVLTQNQKQLQQEKKENQKLKQQLVQVQSTDFIEQVARNKLFLVKPGEQELIINKELLQGSSSAQKQPEAQKSNFEEWISLFF